MKFIKNFNQYSINELFVHKSDGDLEGKQIILFQKDLFIFDTEEWESKEIWKQLNGLLSKDVFEENYGDSMVTLREQYPNIIKGEIENNIIVLTDYNGLRHSEHSDDLRKLSKELGMGIKVNHNTGSYLQNEEDLYVFPEKKKLSNRTFYHGTCLKYLKDILNTGIKPVQHSNFESINHENKVFFTLNQEKAVFHSYQSAKKNNSFPIIIELKVPDVSKLVVDYDLAGDIYGDGHDIMNDLGYSNIETYFKKSGIDYEKDITNKIGIYGYLGRIPVTHIQNIWMDLNSFQDLQYIFNPNYGEGNIEEQLDDLHPVRNWGETDKYKILNIIEDIEEEYEEEFGTDDE